MKECANIPLKWVFAVWSWGMALALSACLDAPPVAPPRDNPWDPANPAPPRAPGQFRARSLSETAVLLTWQDQSGNETGFHIYEQFPGEPSEHLADSTEADKDSLVLCDRPPNLERIDYTIEAYNYSGAADYRPIAITSTRDAPPLPPTDFQATLINDTTIQLNWVDHSAVEDHFEIEVSLSEPTHFARAAEAPANSSGAVIPRQAAGVRHFLRARAVNRFGASPYTETVSVM